MLPSRFEGNGCISSLCPLLEGISFTVQTRGPCSASEVHMAEDKTLIPFVKMGVEAPKFGSKDVVGDGVDGYPFETVPCDFWDLLARREWVRQLWKLV